MTVQPTQTTMTISDKGQVVIPAHIRQKFNWKPGTKVVVSDAHPTQITFKKQPPRVPLGTKYRGSLKGQIISTKKYLELKKQDKLLEDRKHI